MENNSLFGKLVDLIEAYSEKHDEKPQRILMGYKAYYELMRNSHFSTEVTNSALDPNKRKFKKIKIKITKDDFQLDLE
ncbi:MULTISPECIES: hypothetical protein [Acinetobacter]|jgi:hypothetical protein|uniref:hypothetical protein n=1 Tax=Acinetobacter TaxID=469 RepID=UPI00125F5F0A|nr:hypothetical protein [Acinetobacter junii]